MADFGNNAVFSQTDASNGTGTMPSWLGSADPSTIDNAGRALQGAAYREWNWRSPTLTTGGTATAYTLTYSVAPAAYYNGQVFSFITNAANGASPTLNVNGLGAKSIKINSGGALVVVPDGLLRVADRVLVAFNTVDDAFVLMNGAGSLALDQWSRPITKLTTTLIASNTVVANDSELQIPMAANTRYQVRGELHLNIPATGGIKFAVSGPTAPTFFNANYTFSASDASNGGNASSAYGTLVSYVPAGALRTIYRISAVLEVAGTAGTFVLQFAQNTSHASSLVIYRGSFIEYKVY